ncbi:MAG: DUF86 domain-containing protein [Rhodospirillales bacterium]|nr:DUF86 domain-containing protein [Rhodospirillales bacterium]
MARRPHDWIDDALHEIDYLRKLTARHPRGALLSDETLNNAMVYSLLKLTEARRNLPKELTEAHKDIPWPAVFSFGNQLRHEYFALADERVLRVAETELMHWSRRCLKCAIQSNVEA